jgi:hypothetical protein
MSTREKHPVIETYDTAQAVGRLISGLGWLVVIIPIMAAVSMLSGSYDPIEVKIMTGGAAAGFSILGLVVVAIGQITRAIVHTATNTAEILRRIEQNS